MQVNKKFSCLLHMRPNEGAQLQREYKFTDKKTRKFSVHIQTEKSAPYLKKKKKGKPGNAKPYLSCKLLPLSHRVLLRLERENCTDEMVSLKRDDEKVCLLECELRRTTFRTVVTIFSSQRNSVEAATRKKVNMWVVGNDFFSPMLYRCFCYVSRRSQKCV